MKEPNIGLALGGGVVLGAAHIGVLKAFEEHHIPIGAIAGTSAGAVVGACFAAGVPLKDIEMIAQKIGWTQIASLPQSTLGIASNKGLATLLEGILPVKNIEETKIPLRILATEVTHGAVKIFSTGSITEAVRASACVLIFFSPVVIDNEMYVDGGLVENVPLSALAHTHTTIRVGVNLTGYEKTFMPKGLPDMIDLCVFLFSKHRGTSLRSQAQVLIEPDLHAYDAKNFGHMRSIIDAGYEAGLRAIPEIQALLEKSVEKPTFMQRVLSVFFKTQKIDE